MEDNETTVVLSAVHHRGHDPKCRTPQSLQSQGIYQQTGEEKDKTVTVSIVPLQGLVPNLDRMSQNLLNRLGLHLYRLREKGKKMTAASALRHRGHPPSLDRIRHIRQFLHLKQTH